MPSPTAAAPARSRFRAGPVEVAVGLTLVLLLLHVERYAFLTDDAFISFRYARNFSQDTDWSSTRALSA